MTSEEIQDLAVRAVKQNRKYIEGSAPHDAAAILANGIIIGKGLSPASRPFLAIQLKNFIYSEIMKTRWSGNNPCAEIFLSEPEEVMLVPEKKKCECESISLLRYGCKCGGV